MGERDAVGSVAVGVFSSACVGAERVLYKLTVNCTRYRVITLSYNLRICLCMRTFLCDIGIQSQATAPPPPSPLHPALWDEVSELTGQ